MVFLILSVFFGPFKEKIILTFVTMVRETVFKGVLQQRREINKEKGGLIAQDGGQWMEITKRRHQG